MKIIMLQLTIISLRVCKFIIIIFEHIISMLINVLTRKLFMICTIFFIFMINNFFKFVFKINI